MDLGDQTDAGEVVSAVGDVQLDLDERDHAPTGNRLAVVTPCPIRLLDRLVNQVVALTKEVTCVVVVLCTDDLLKREHVRGHLGEADRQHWLTPRPVAPAYPRASRQMCTRGVGDSRLLA